ncbi:MAG: hypothetical protein LBK29_02025 [Oscillospiraceae bacterium]|jgi:hypothetical protein|nr:hypothetical protein [Oscillospiraceae bacterium]
MKFRFRSLVLALIMTSSPVTFNVFKMNPVYSASRVSNGGPAKKRINVATGIQPDTKKRLKKVSRFTSFLGPIVGIVGIVGFLSSSYLKLTGIAEGLVVGGSIVVIVISPFISLASAIIREISYR